MSDLLRFIDQHSDGCFLALAMVCMAFGRWR